MATARERHVATRLADGRVLVAGGTTTTSYGLPMASSEIYNPRTRTWTAAANMPIAVADAAAATLPDGTVLVAGGAGTATQLYNPATNTWTRGPSMPASNTGPTFATTLPNGTIFVMGTSASAYNPAIKTWKALATPPTPTYRTNNSWTTLPNGDVATTSTMQYAGAMPSHPVTGPSVYHWRTNTWTTTRPPGINLGRGVVAAGLPNGNVMVTGGVVDYLWFPSSVTTVMEVNPTTGAWTTDGDVSGGSELVQLPNGSILATGAGAVDYVYGPKAGTWTKVPGRQTVSSSSFTTLADGTVLAAGGDEYSGYQRVGAANQAAVYTP